MWKFTCNNRKPRWVYCCTFFPSLLVFTFLILFAAFIQFLSRSCPLPFLQIPSPIHSQKLIHNQEEEEDQPQATPPSGTHVQMCQAHLYICWRDSLQMCTTCTYVNVCTDSHGKITFMDSRAVLCCYLSNSHAAFWSNLDPPQAYRSLVYTPLALTSSRCTCILLL